MFTTIVCCLAIVYVAYKYFTANFDYWRKRNVPHEKPIAVFGNFAPVIFMRKSFGDIVEDLHKKYRESPLVGFYKLTTPCLLLTTPEYVEQAFVQDSNFFWQNEFTIQPDVDPIAAKGAFFLKGQKWKKSRGLFTPLLSNAKMKHVTPLMVRATAKMLEYIDKKKVLETRDLMSRYVSEASALATFGVEAESFDKDDAFYRALGRKLTEPDGYNAIKILTMVLAPKLAKFLKLKFIPDDSAEFVRQTIKTALKHRKDNNLKHNDFLEFIMSLKNEDFDDDDVLAWSFGFFTEPNTSNQSSYILYCLAKHEDVQSKLRTEINRVLDKYNGDVCFEALQEMTYLHCVIQETMRLHPSLRMNMKKCTGYYEFPTPNGQKEVINLEPGMSIAVSIYAMQTDERYFENPMEFDPERFSDKREGNFAKGAYMPFGLGKRMCAGMKLAQNLMKISTVILVKEYELSLNERTKEPLDLDPKYNPIAVPKSGLWINFNKL